MDRFHRTAGMVLVVALVGLFFCRSIAAGGDIPAVECRLDVPENVDPSTLEVTVFEAGPSTVRNDWNPVAVFPADAGGIVRLVYTPTKSTQLEISGPGVRRARFPFPENVPGRRPSLRLDRGYAAELNFISAEGSAPVAGVLAGPITADQDVPWDLQQGAFPFFVRSGDGGDARISGLAAEGGYEALVSAEGYVSRYLAFRTGEAQTVPLERGGFHWHGVVLGEKTRQPVAGALIRIESEAWPLPMEIRADGEGKFAVAGMAEGLYRVGAQDEMADSLRMISLDLNETSASPDWTLYVAEGVNIEGLVADVETGAPVAGALLRLGDQSARTGVDGAFVFRLVRGPWPRDIVFEHSEFTFERQDQDISVYPFNGYEGIDLTNMVLSVRRKRVLDVTVAAGDEPMRAMLDLYSADPGGSDMHLALSSVRTVIPLPEAGRRIAVLRDQKGMVSEIVPVETTQDQTTTTLVLVPGLAATLETHVIYEGEGDAVAPVYELVVYTREASAGARIRLAAASADANGTAVLSELPPGVFDIVLDQAEGAPLSQQSVDLVRGETTNVELTVPRGIELTGLVHDEAGKALDEMPVTIYAHDASGAEITLSAMTSGGGHFVFKGLGGSSVRLLRIDHSQYAPLVSENLPLPSAALDLTMKARAGIEVTLPPFVLTESATAYSLLSVRSPAPDGTEQWFGNIDAQESFAGEAEVQLLPRAEGRIRVAVNASGKWDVSEPIQWSADAKPIKLVLQPGRTAELRVDIEGADSDEELTALDATLLNTTLPEDKSETSFAPASRRRGRLTFTGLPAGDYILMISTPGGAAATLANIAVESGSTKTVSLAISAKTVRLNGQVVLDDENASPAQGALVDVFFDDVPDEEALAHAETDAEGRFLVPQLLPSRRYILRISHEQVEDTFPLSVGDSQEEIANVYTLRAPQRYTLRLSPRLGEMVARSPATPFIFRSENGNPVILRLETGEAPTVLLAPGSYTVAWGETELGSIEARKGSNTISLLDPL